MLYKFRLGGLEASSRDGWSLSAKWLAAERHSIPAMVPTKNYVFHVTTRKLLLVLSKELPRTCALGYGMAA